MPISPAVTLTDRERATVEQIIRGIAGRIGEVKVFGSRATGRARPSSDLDLVVYPPIAQRELYDLMDAFEESDLPIFVDVVPWDRITSEALRDQIRRYAVPLFVDEA